MTASLLQPGVYFQTEPEPAVDVLPRMDVAAFVGFAAAGPVDTPVPVEDLDRFREIFGADLPLAWDAAAGRLRHAHLGPAVESFFRNGGRRCWIVRVATAPRRHRFELPGLHAAAGLAPALAVSRAAGSWADALRAGTLLERRRLPLPATGPAPFAAAADADAYTLDLAVAPAELVAGDLLSLRWRDLGLRLFLFVDDAAAEAGATRVSGAARHWFDEAVGSPASPPAGSPGLPLTAADLALDETTGLALWGGATEPPEVERLAFGLVVWRAEPGLATAARGESWQLEGRLGGLAFHPEHPRFWGRLPADEALFRLPHGHHQPPQPPEVRAFLDEAASPRFPLAAAAASGACLPLGMADEASTALAAAPLDPLAETALERDGLAAFGSGLFVDPDLAWASGQALLTEAEHKLYERRLPLAGMHSLLPVDEPSLVAVPDAVHAGWTRERPPVAPPLGAPTLLHAGAADDGDAELRWTAVAGAGAYRVEQSADPGFEDAREVARTAELEARVDLGAACPRRLWFRVRAADEAQLGPWSNTRSAVLPPAAFADCAERRVAGLALDHQPDSPGPGGTLAWSADPALPGTVAPAVFEVQSSTTAGFEAVGGTATVDGGDSVLAVGAGALLYYRVRGRGGDLAGPWSNTVVVLPSGPGDWSLLPAAKPAAELLSVQRALLRLCAARRDLLALLAAPAGWLEADLVEHLRQLEPGDHEAGAAAAGAVRPLRLAEADALGFGAFYHPWVTTFPEQRARAGDTVVLDSAPPEGTVAGSMAALALRDGAWIAPANRPLEGVLALTPPLDRAVRPALLARRVNLLVHEPRGIFAWNAETLARELDVRPIGVRRLLVLLRRLALREGGSYVFEPNDRRLRGLVRHRFENVLSDLFVRGALAGRSAEEAYRVVLDDSAGTPREVDRGRFLVELRVAPSRPLVFLTVRLVQDGPERLSVQEA